MIIIAWTKLSYSVIARCKHIKYPLNEQRHFKTKEPFKYSVNKILAKWYEKCPCRA